MSEAREEARATGAPAAAPVETPHKLGHRVEGLSCPNCGGALEVDTGLRVVECPYCATPLLALSEVGIRRFAVQAEVDSERARRITREWLGRGLKKDGRLRKEAEVGEAFLTFLPFYRVEADGVGVALGTEERRRTVGSGKNRRVQVYEVNVERRVERSFDRTYPGVNVAEWGIQRVDLRGDPLVPYLAESLARRGMVFPPTASAAELRASALEGFRLETDPSRGLKRTRFRFLETLRERMSVVYYPLWVVRYTFRERSYQVLVDAQDGSLAYGKAPGNDLYRALMLVLTEAAAAYIGTTVLQHAAFETPLVLGGAAALGLLVWGFRRFRYGGVVIEGTGTVRAPSKLAGSLDGLARVARSFRP